MKQNFRLLLTFILMAVVILILSLFPLYLHAQDNDHWLFLPVILRDSINQPPTATPTATTRALNHSYCTTCAEEDNINVPLVGPPIYTQMVITASHGVDINTISNASNSCAADFSGCPITNDTVSSAVQSDTCFSSADNKLFDNGQTALWVCTEPSWWQPTTMTVTNLIGNHSLVGHRLVWVEKISDANSWPQVLVLYEDGNMRLKPHPPTHLDDTCFGSSVIVGSAPTSSRPFVNIQAIDIDPLNHSLKLHYREGGTATLALSVNREVATVVVDIDYDPVDTYAVFRSMFVAFGNADVDHVTSGEVTYLYLTGTIDTWEPSWTSIPAEEWFFHRQVSSQHNTSAPDIAVKLGSQ